MTVNTNTEHINILPELQSLIPPLKADEFTQLEKNCIEHGITDPLIIAVWPDENGEEQKAIGDGHNRYRIARKNDLQFKTINRQFESLDAVKDWMIEHQLGRRNLTKEQMSYLRGVQYNREKKKHGGTGANQFTSREEKISPLQNKTAQRLAEQHKVTDRTIKNDEKFALAVNKIAEVAGDDIKHKILGRDVKATKEDILKLSTKAPEKIIEITTKAIETKDLKKVNIAHVGNNSGENEWYTPIKYIEAARKVMGGIDLDPASCITANELIRAEKIFTIDDSGLDNDWFGNIWLNPPYSQPLINLFSDKIIEQCKNFNNCLVLVNNATETKWFQKIASVSSAICFPSGRVKFWHPDRVSAPLQGQAILYIGRKVEEFKNTFSEFGFVAKI